MTTLWKEELNIIGATSIGKILTDDEINLYKTDVINKKNEDINKFGKEKLLEIGDYETVRDLARFGGKYFTLLENETINNLVNSVLNDKAVVHSYNAIINKADGRSQMVGFKFHRDQPYFSNTRTSIIVMIPLVDYSKTNGSTEFIPTSHLFETMPSNLYVQNHTIATSGNAGEAFAVDAALWHRAGINTSNFDRPMIVIKYTLAPFKQQVDFCTSAKQYISLASDLVKQRLGWNVRVCDSYEEYRLVGDQKKFKSGQYDMSNTKIH